MSLSTDIHAFKKKSANVFELTAEHHPVLVTLVSVVAMVSALMLLTNLLLR